MQSCTEEKEEQGKTSETNKTYKYSAVIIFKTTIPDIIWLAQVTSYTFIIYSFNENYDFYNELRKYYGRILSPLQLNFNIKYSCYSRIMN